MKVTRVPNISNKPRHQKLANHLYNTNNRDNSLNAMSRDSPVAKGSGIPKLQNISGQNGPSILPKMDANMRATHLKLDPIDTTGIMMTSS